MGALAQSRRPGVGFGKGAADRRLRLDHQRLAGPVGDHLRRFSGAGSDGRGRLPVARGVPEPRSDPPAGLGDREGAGGDAGAGGEPARRHGQYGRRPDPRSGDDRHHAGLRRPGPADHRLPSGVQDRHPGRLRPSAVRDLEQDRLPGRTTPRLCRFVRAQGSGPGHCRLRRPDDLRSAPALRQSRHL